MKRNLTRRYFLQVVAVGAAGTAGALACSGNNGSQPEPFGDVAAGNVSDLQADTVRSVPGAPAFVGRDSNGVYAMTTTCTHQGCDMSSSVTLTSLITCNCHQSEFDLNGTVKRGPAVDPLAHFAVSIAPDGTITVHGGTQVAASVRISVA